jgi:hypothetical protein
MAYRTNPAPLEALRDPQTLSILALYEHVFDKVKLKTEVPSTRSPGLADLALTATQLAAGLETKLSSSVTLFLSIPLRMTTNPIASEQKESRYGYAW